MVVEVNQWSEATPELRGLDGKVSADWVTKGEMMGVVNQWGEIGVSLACTGDMWVELQEQERQELTIELPPHNCSQQATSLKERMGGARQD